MNGQTRIFSSSEGDGYGTISFCPGHPNSPFVRPGQRQSPPLDFTKKKGSDGPIDNWGDFREEMGVRDQGARGVPIDYQPAHHKVLGLRDSKEAVASRMLEALHAGNSAYFEGLAKMLRKFKTVKGNPLPEPDDQAQEVLDAIRIAAQEADGPPFQHDVLDKLCWPANYKLDKLSHHYLTPLGFGWLPRRRSGRPKKLP